MKLFIAPHNDDETLFGAFTLLREKPLVVIVFDGHVQGNRGANVTAAQRRAETLAAMDILGCEVKFLGLSDAGCPATALYDALNIFGEPEMVYAPAIEADGHEQHNAVGLSAGAIFQNVTHYMTYTRAGKSTGVPVPFEPEWPLLKLRALACYESQIVQPVGCVEHFLRDQHEYYANDQLG